MLVTNGMVKDCCVCVCVQLGGRDLPGLADLHLEEQLVHLMNGGCRRENGTGRMLHAAPSQLVMVSVKGSYVGLPVW